MGFWTKQNSLSAADIAAQGKKERYARKWRNTTFAAVDKLDASGNEAVRTAFLHICARLGAQHQKQQQVVAVVQLEDAECSESGYNTISDVL